MISVIHNDRLSGSSNYTIKRLFILWSSMLINYQPSSFKLTNFLRFFLKYLALFFRNNDCHEQYLIEKKTF